MARQRVLFRLSMPNTGSWDGKWSGAARNYVLVRSIPEKRVQELEIPASWYHNFGDGWGASVSAKVMERGERKPKSDGFYGYDWMVDRIIRWGDTDCRHEFQPDPRSGQQYFDGEWERCTLCQMSRQIVPTAAIAKAEKNNGS